MDRFKLIDEADGKSLSGAESISSDDDRKEVPTFTQVALAAAAQGSTRTRPPR